jgi:hypothetical protein
MLHAMTALPNAALKVPHWQLACPQPTHAAEGRNLVMLARIAMMDALHHRRAAVRRARVDRIVG